jgi:hypothetical protein
VVLTPGLTLVTPLKPVNKHYWNRLGKPKNRFNESDSPA